MREMVGGCCVCSDDRGWSENPLVYCDGQSCTVAVHQACYGIVSVPTGPWYCRKCESQERAAKVKCELCPSRYGALKRTDNAGWAHVVCALYIPEVRFGNVTTMEPIQLQLIPPERFSKVCYICEEKGKPANASVGACMQCNRAGCKQQFHVTCAQSLGLLCEEAGNYLDNVKYCGYCQHHYSKLKKGGNVKTIPPYKPVSTENQLSDSNSEKEADFSAPAKGSSSQTSSSRKNKSSSTTKSSNSNITKTSKNSPPSNSAKSSSHSNSKSSDKSKVSTLSSSRQKDDDNDKKEAKSEQVETEKAPYELKETKGSKKRKANSRTPTPITLVPNESAISVNSLDAENSASSLISEKKDNSNSASDSLDKIKKARVDLAQSITANQPIVALTSLPTLKSSPSSASPTNATVTESALPAQSIIQPTHPAVNSLVVSVPLSNTSLSPHHNLGNQTTVLISNVGLHSEKSNSLSGATTEQDLRSNLDSLKIEDEGTSSSMLTSNMDSAGLRIAYEKQESMANNTEVDMELEEIPAEVPVKRTRSQSNDKTEPPKVSSRGKKRNGNSNTATNANGNTSGRRSGGRGTQQTPSPQQPGAFASISQSQIKNSPPSSPSSESQGPVPNAKGRPKGSRKSAPAATGTSNSNSKDTKDTKMSFTNGVIAPHMLGNQLNPNSNMAHKMSEHLSSELEAHSIFNPNENSNLVGPQLQHKVIASARASNQSSASSSVGGGLSSMLGGAGGGTVPQTLDQLLERQWEQGSQFLMEQAQHFDIASLLSCLHQLRAENTRLEEHVSSLLQRRDHLLAVNARLAIPLTGQPVTPQSSHTHTVNNIHPAVAGNHGEVPRPDVPRSRHSTGSANYPAHPQGTSAVVPIENGIPSDSNQSFVSQGHHSPVRGQAQPSPNVRQPSPAGTQRQNMESTTRSESRLQQYSLYQGAGSSTQQQVAVRRDSEHINSKPS